MFPETCGHLLVNAVHTVQPADNDQMGISQTYQRWQPLSLRQDRQRLFSQDQALAEEQIQSLVENHVMLLPFNWQLTENG